MIASHRGTLVLPGAFLALLAMLAAVRALWLYGQPPRVRWAFLAVAASGVVGASVAWGAGAPLWVRLTALVVAVGPITLWVTWRWLNHTGRPAGLIAGPALLERVEEVLDDTLATQLRVPEEKPPRRPGA